MFFSEGILLFSSFFKEKNNNEIIYEVVNQEWYNL
jgi:hypothetical protein